MSLITETVTRTALHLAAAEGHDKVIEYLLRSKVNPNPRDRWNATPLQDALFNSHSVAATLLRTKGGKASDLFGVEAVCTAASQGDVPTLRMLHEFGLPMDKGDYDMRFPLHLAAAEGRILALSFLLGISTDPNCQDRWQGTPMDDALQGGTLYHHFCGKMLQVFLRATPRVEEQIQLRVRLSFRYYAQIWWVSPCLLYTPSMIARTPMHV